MFQLFSEGSEDLYTGMIESLVRNTPDLWEDFAVRTPSGEFYLVDPDANAPTTTDPTSGNILDIQNNVQFSPKMCLWLLIRSWNLQENVLFQDSLPSSAILS